MDNETSTVAEQRHFPNNLRALTRLTARHYRTNTFLVCMLFTVKHTVGWFRGRHNTFFSYCTLSGVTPAFRSAILVKIPSDYQRFIPSPVLSIFCIGVFSCLEKVTAFCTVGLSLHWDLCAYSWRAKLISATLLTSLPNWHINLSREN